MNESPERLSMYILESAVARALEDDDDVAYLRLGTGQYRMLMHLYGGNEPRFPLSKVLLSFGLEVSAVWDKIVPAGMIIVENSLNNRVATIENLEEP